ncbi:MAG: MFS transporter [Thermodesulfobacteriota bacterium]
MVYYGWTVLFICFINVCGEGAVKNLFPLILLPLSETFGWSRAATSAIFSAAGLFSGLCSPMVGTLLDRLGPRKFFPLGGALLLIGLLLVSRIETYWQFIVVYACLVATGENIISSYTNFAVLGRWFQRKIGSAIGIADTGTTIGAAVFIPLVQWMIIRTDWRHALELFAVVIFFLLVPLNLIFMRASPVDKGQLPDGRKHPESLSSAPGPNENIPATVFPFSLTFRESFDTPSLYYLIVSRFFSSAAAYMISIHFIAFFVGAGYGEMTAASALAFTQLVSTAGRPPAGALSDRIGREITITLSFTLSIAAVMVILGFGNGVRLWPVVLFVLLRGFGMGPVGIAAGAKAADLYPAPILGRVMGVINVGRGLGLAAGPLISGLIYDATGSYLYAFSLAVVFMILSVASFWMAHLKRGVITGCRA